MRPAVSGSRSAGLGLLMAATAAVGTQGPAVAAVVAAVVSVLASVVYRPAATLAVLFAVLSIAAGNAAPILAGVSGLFAVGYLVVRNAATVTAPTVLAAAGFAVVGVAATAFPLRLPWLPLIAPLAVFGCYLLAVRPFLGERG